jgi:hypothetical protein
MALFGICHVAINLQKMPPSHRAIQLISFHLEWLTQWLTQVTSILSFIFIKYFFSFIVILTKVGFFVV